MQQIVDGLTAGSIYGALALALVLVYRSTGLVNFAQGQMAAVSVYIGWSLVSAGLPVGVAVVLTLVLIYILRKPLTWIFIAGFIAIALSGPIAFLERWMKRGLAIAIVYIALILTPFALIGLLVPPVVTQANNLVNNLPEYAQQFTDFVNNNDQLRKLQQDYDLERTRYTELSAQHQRALIAEDVARKQGGERFVVLNLASLPSSPDSPDLTRLMLLSLAMGLVLGAGYDLVGANAMKNFIVLVFTAAALVVFVVNDQVQWTLGLLLGVYAHDLAPTAEASDALLAALDRVRGVRAFLAGEFLARPTALSADGALLAVARCAAVGEFRCTRSAIAFTAPIPPRLRLSLTP